MRLPPRLRLLAPRRRRGRRPVLNIYIREALPADRAIVTLLMLFPVFRIPFRFIRLWVRDLWVALWPITRSTAAMAIATVALRRLILGSIRLPTVLALLIFVPFGAVIYFAMMYWRNKALLVESLTLARTAIGVFARARA